MPVHVQEFVYPGIKVPSIIVFCATFNISVLSCCFTFCYAAVDCVVLSICICFQELQSSELLRLPQLLVHILVKRWNTCTFMSIRTVINLQKRNLISESQTILEYVCQVAQCEYTREDIFPFIVEGPMVQGDVGVTSIKTAPSMTNLSTCLPAGLSANTVSLFRASYA